MLQLYGVDGGCAADSNDTLHLSLHVTLCLYISNESNTCVLYSIVVVLSELEIHRAGNPIELNAIRTVSIS